MVGFGHSTPSDTIRYDSNAGAVTAAAFGAFRPLALFHRYAKSRQQNQRTPQLHIMCVCGVANTGGA